MHPRQIGFRISSMQLNTSARDIFSRHQQQQKTPQQLITTIQGSTKHCYCFCISTQYKTDTEVGNRRNVSPPSSVILSKGSSSQPWAFPATPCVATLGPSSKAVWTARRRLSKDQEQRPSATAGRIPCTTIRSYQH
ncbi:hypothetical protein Nepgr_009377 [Nepenthes gracilis]|uniref:Uncharacterized protein n=1 Tax=Nepenthes gracilis TaxID=150966 RepID=A0AAD3SAR9_NEPGR|nr:hypothetical protein Nepgr_009377 [Nepenthes gracilis]